MGGAIQARADADALAATNTGGSRTSRASGPSSCSGGCSAASGRHLRTAPVVDAPAPRSPPPKRPATAYMCWTRSRRPALTTDRPELAASIAEQARALASEWKELDAGARRPFELEAEELREQYVNAKAAYDARHRDAAVGNLLRRKPKPTHKRRSKSRWTVDDEASDEESSGNSEE